MGVGQLQLDVCVNASGAGRRLAPFGVHVTVVRSREAGPDGPPPLPPSTEPFVAGPCPPPPPPPITEHPAAASCSSSCS